MGYIREVALDATPGALRPQHDARHASHRRLIFVAHSKLYLGRVLALRGRLYFPSFQSNQQVIDIPLN